MDLVHSGKVRELYTDGGGIIMVASDRVSVDDVVLPTPIPGKGTILTQLSLWWFAQLADVTPNHVLSGADVPAEWAGRAIRFRRLRMLPVECVARGYLAGPGPASYRETGTISGVRLPHGLGEGSKLPSRSSRPPRRPTAEWRPGGPQRSLDKQFLRDWSSRLDWDRKPPGPAIPPDVAAATADRYTELYERITRT